jgi:hypothetical protein
MKFQGAFNFFPYKTTEGLFVSLEVVPEQGEPDGAHDQNANECEGGVLAQGESALSVVSN